MGLQELTKRREDLLRRLKAAQAKDCGYAHNDEIAESIARELSNVEDEIASLSDAYEPVPLFAPGIVGEILDAIVSNAARDRRQAGGK